MADSELDRVLRQEFKSRPTKRGGSLGSVRPEQLQTDGRSEAIVGRKGVGQMGRVLDEIDRSKCPAWLNEECLRILSRFLEETFRNFQVTARPPSHMAPPFKARIIDAFPAGVVNIASDVLYTTIVSFRCPESRFRGEIWAFGQAAESLAAFDDLSWRIRVNGQPYDPYIDIRFQLWQFVNPEKNPAPIHLREGDLIEVQARTLTPAVNYDVAARISGWYYPIRSEGGDEIKSTLVD